MADGTPAEVREESADNLMRPIPLDAGTSSKVRTGSLVDNARVDRKQ